MDIRDATIVVTGASRGLGRAIAIELAGRGGVLALAARSEKDLKAVRREIELAEGRAIIVPTDLTVAEERALLVKTVEKELGPIDVLVNNAGIEHVSRFAETSETDIVRVLDLDLTSTMLLTRLALPGMLERRSGHVVTISSVAGKVATPYASVYAAAKAGLVGWSHSLRVEMRGTGVGVSLVCPGFVRDEGMFAEWATDGDVVTMWMSGLLTSPSAVAHAVARAVEHNVPEILPSGPLAKLAHLGWGLSPRLAEVITAHVPAVATGRREAERRRLFTRKTS
ncbi:MAG: SDR family NAD(P)-dependent oxidoreductase [Actinomycetota bacterium]